jgi:hypothetical protein
MTAKVLPWPPIQFLRSRVAALPPRDLVELGAEASLLVCLGDVFGNLGEPSERRRLALKTEQFLESSA